MNVFSYWRQVQVVSSPFCCVALPGPAPVDNGKLGNISNGNATVKIWALK